MHPRLQMRRARSHWFPQHARPYLQHSAQRGRARVHKAQEQHQLERYWGAEVPQQGGCKRDVRGLRWLTSLVPAAPAKALSMQRAPGCMSRPGNIREKPAPSLAKVAHTLMVRTPCGCSLVARRHATSVRAALFQMNGGRPGTLGPPPPAEARQAASCTVWPTQRRMICPGPGRLSCVSCEQQYSLFRE